MPHSLQSLPWHIQQSIVEYSLYIDRTILLTTEALFGPARCVVEYGWDTEWPGDILPHRDVWSSMEIIDPPTKRQEEHSCRLPCQSTPLSLARTCREYWRLMPLYYANNEFQLRNLKSAEAFCQVLPHRLKDFTSLIAMWSGAFHALPYFLPLATNVTRITVDWCCKNDIKLLDGLRLIEAVARSDHVKSVQWSNMSGMATEEDELEWIQKRPRIEAIIDGEKDLPTTPGMFGNNVRALEGTARILDTYPFRRSTVQHMWLIADVLDYDLYNEAKGAAYATGKDENGLRNCCKHAREAILEHCDWVGYYDWVGQVYGHWSTCFEIAEDGSYTKQHSPGRYEYMYGLPDQSEILQSEPRYFFFDS